MKQTKQKNKKIKKVKPPKNMEGKAKDFKGAWIKLFKYCKKYYFAFIIAFIFSIAGTVMILVGPDKLKEITDTITSGIMTGIDLNLVTQIGLLLVLLYSGSIILSTTQNLIMNKVTQKITKRMRTEITSKINKLPMSSFGENKTGDILSRVTNDVDVIGETFNENIGSLVSSITLFIGSIIMMLLTNVVMTITAIVSTLIGFLFMGIIMTKSQKYFALQQQKLGQINAHIEEVYSGHLVVKAYNAEEQAKKTFEDINNVLKASNFKAQSLSGLMMPIMSFIGNFGYVAVCIVGAVMVMNGSITFGVIVAFMIYVRYFTQPLSEIAQVMQALQLTAAAGERVFDFLEEKEMETESDKKVYNKKVIGNVEFRNIRFGYNDNQVVIKNFSANVKAGQKIAIVGPTGAGKSTLVNLLMRFYELNQPKLIINNVITEYSVFKNGKSIRLKVNENRKVFIDGKETEFILDEKLFKDFPQNKDLKFDQDFNLKFHKEFINVKVDVLTGDEIDSDLKTAFGVAYYGDILVDDIPTKSISRENLHMMFCMVLQDTWTFNGTIKENLIYNTENVTDERIIKTCEAVGLDHFIRTLPQGYDTILNDEVTLSAGQKQELTIARAMIADRPMLILDEATSLVDTRTEIIIQNAMDKLMKNKTSFVIAHRLSTIKNADLILVINNGDIIESGTHNSLMEKKGFYENLYNSQFEEAD